MSSFTTDSFFKGKLRVMQSRRGYRFSIDAVLLAHYSAPIAADKVLDLGTGCGIVSLIMAYRCTDLKVYAVEVQKELADLALTNIRQNRMENRIELLLANLNDLTPQMTGGPCDLIVTNPPYYRIGSGRINPDSQRALARHELKTTLGEILLSTRRMLRTSGRFVCIYAAERTGEILSVMRQEQIEPKLIRMIHSNRSSDARLILIEGVNKARPGLKIAPPLFLYDESGAYTDEVQQIFEMRDDIEHKTEDRKQN
ncbi:MAG: tRNA1(Val) (adenine(37)-N6)-methyltransferase [Desulfobacterales bacterium]|nr:tRNA1(Val) (adenine(37)-N6)-methyltransferase [Desulfobacterales bacterium]